MIIVSFSVKPIIAKTSSVNWRTTTTAANSTGFIDTSANISIDVSFNEGESTSVEYEASDVDSDLSVSVTSSESDVDVSVSDGFIHISSDGDYYGSSVITVSASEDNDGGITVSQVFNANILPVNDAPALRLYI